MVVDVVDNGYGCFVWGWVFFGVDEVVDFEIECEVGFVVFGIVGWSNVL